jgi:DNA-binding transcriptional ArsR family regulator
MLDRMASVLKLLAHPQRLKIIEILEARREAPVHAVTERLGLPQAVTSQHLNAMKRAGLVASRRRGKEVWYEIADPRSITILDCIRKQKGARP